MSNRTAIVIGATGLVGGQLLKLLLGTGAWETITAVTRRPLGWEAPGLVNLVIPFDSLNKAASRMKADDAFCCLGTTLRQAGNKAEFNKVDYGYSLEFAQIMRRNGASHFLLLTAIGSDRHSPFFYSRIKGRLEADIKALGFDSLSVFRPSLLLGKRNEKRGAEALAASMSQVISPLMVGPLLMYRAIPGTVVAGAMCQRALELSEGSADGRKIFTYAGMSELARKLNTSVEEA